MVHLSVKVRVRAIYRRSAGDVPALGRRGAGVLT